MQVTIDTSKVINRYFYEETEAAYNGFADDETLGVAIEDAMLEKLDKYRGVFELCSLAPNLISYFSFKYNLVKTEDVLTALEKKDPHMLQQKSHGRHKKIKGNKIPNQAFLLKRVPALRIVTEAKSIRKFSPPQYTVTVSGFFRQLKNPKSYGKDENQNPILGVTWVKSHDRWKNRPKRRKEILIKSRLSIARQIVDSQDLANEIRQSKPIVSKLSSSSKKGLIRIH